VLGFGLGATVIKMVMPYVFPGVRGVKLIESTVNVTNSANPIVLTKNVTLAIIDCCAPLPFRLTAHCIGAGAVLAMSITSPNPITVGSALHIFKELYDEC